MYRVRILGVGVDCIDMEAALELLGRWIESKEPCRQVVTVNPEFVMLAGRDRRFAAVLEQADLCLADGSGVLWAVRRRGCRLRSKVAGSDLVPALAGAAARRGHRLFLLGAGPGVAAEAARRLAAGSPGLAIAGVHEGSPAIEEEEDIIARVRAAGADVLLVAYGAPAQDLWIARNRHRLPVAVAIGVGGTLDFVAGKGEAGPTLAPSSPPGVVLPPASPALASASNGSPAGLFRPRAIGESPPSAGLGFGAVSAAIRLSVVVPCFDEEGRLPQALAHALPYLDGRGGSYELILVDDGSSDGTLELMRRAATSNRRVRVVAVTPNQGKGHALAAGVSVSIGSRVLVSDCDFSTPITELPKLEQALDAGAAVAIASRGKRASEVEVSQPLYRVLMGKVFNLMVQAVLLPGLWDTQCGFKLFEGGVARKLFASIRTHGFGYDIEVLVLARRQGSRVAEVPVRWINSSPTKVAPVRHSLEMLLDIFRIRFRH